jgi:hypothetical protein
MNIIRRLLKRLRRRPAHDSRLRLYRLMRLRGVVLLDPLSPEEQSAFALAARRCGRCPSLLMCDEALANQPDGLRLFCPNTHYVEALRRRSLEFS